MRIKTRIRKRTPIQILIQLAQALARILEEQEVLISVRLRHYLTESEIFLKVNVHIPTQTELDIAFRGGWFR